MANICENNFYAYSESPENIEIINNFFKEWKYNGNANIEKDTESIQVYFYSRWSFPTEDMNKLHELISDKDDIYMRCLSVEFGELYHEMMVDDGDGWYNV